MLSVTLCTLMARQCDMAEFRLGGAQCNPPVKRIIAGYNPWEVDRDAAGLLGLDWNNIGHIVADFR